MYGKLFTQIYDGSLREDPMVRLVFMDMVILADRDGIVDMTHEAISARTNIPAETIYNAIDKLESEDKRSRSPKENGCRIKRLDKHRDWGWELVNYEYYMRKGTRADKNEKDKIRMARIRNNNKSVAKSSKESKSVADVAHIDVDVDIDKRIIVETFSLKDNSEYAPTQTFLQQIKPLYPFVDLIYEFKNMKAWCISNPKKRKTRDGAKRFINNWLSSAQKTAKKINQEENVPISKEITAENVDDIYAN